MRIPSSPFRCHDMLAVASVLVRFLLVATPSQAAEHRRPVIQELWIQIAGDPNLGQLTHPKQQPVDFGIWQAADGTWQLWSCIRGTKEPGQFYLFRTQRYGVNQQTSVYFSRDPMDFGVDHDEGHFACTLPAAAPEIIKHEGDYYIAALLPSLKGIRIAHLEWVMSK